MTPAVIYARFSPRPNAAECDSNRKQFQRCRAYCVSHGYDVAAVRWDRDLCGGRADNRPGLRRALEDACAHKAVLVVYAIDRLSRNTEELLAMTRRLTDSAADLASITESFNTRHYLGRFFLTILAAIATMQREATQERTSLAMRKYQAEGRRMTRRDRCPYGWRPDPADPDQLVEDPEEQAAIERIRQERRAGLGLRAIARALDRAGIACRGHRWHDSTVRAILRRAGSQLNALP